jgi:hypothetical protein
MTTHPRDVVAVPDGTLAFNEPALKQIAVLFNRIAFPGLSKFRSLSDTHTKSPEYLLRLADKGILFEPEIQNSDDQTFKSLMEQDWVQLYKRYSVSAEDLLASRTDEKKASEVMEKTRAISPESISEKEQYAAVRALKRMAANAPRFAAAQLRNLNNLDAHAVVSSESSPWEQDDEHSNRHDVLQILVNALPLPDKDVSWEQIIEYRSDPNSLNRFLDLRNWIRDIARGKLTPLEAEQRLQPVLTRFHKQTEILPMKTVSRQLNAFVTTSPDVLRNLLSYAGGTKFCFFAHRKLVLLEGEALSDVSEVVFVLESTFLSDRLEDFADKSPERKVSGSTPAAGNQYSSHERV